MQNGSFHPEAWKDAARCKPGLATIQTCLTFNQDSPDLYRAARELGDLAIRCAWDMQSGKVFLAEHVGHTVTATDVVSNATMQNMKEGAKDAAKDSGATKIYDEHRHLTVTQV